MSSSLSQPPAPLSLPLPGNNPQKGVHVPGIKPPMLKLALKPYEDLTYEQVDME